MAKRLLDDYPNALLAQSDKIHIIDKTQLDKTKNTRPNHKQGKSSPKGSVLCIAECSRWNLFS